MINDKAISDETVALVAERLHSDVPLESVRRVLTDALLVTVQDVLRSMDDARPEPPLNRHQEIVHQIWQETDGELRSSRVLLARQGERGHRYSAERCVWCNVNVYDELMNQFECEGPSSDPKSTNFWSMVYWPLAEIDALVLKSRGWDK